VAPSAASPRGGSIPINARYMADPSFVARIERSLACGEVDAADYT
jgi:hypothetical protein